MLRIALQAGDPAIYLPILYSKITSIPIQKGKLKWHEYTKFGKMMLNLAEVAKWIGARQLADEIVPPWRDVEDAHIVIRITGYLGRSGEMVDAHGSEPCSVRNGGSSPLFGTLVSFYNADMAELVNLPDFALPRWRNGRRACLRSMWRDPWGFESPSRHQ